MKKKCQNFQKIYLITFITPISTRIRTKKVNNIMSRIVMDLSTPDQTALGHAFEATLGKKLSCIAMKAQKLYNKTLLTGIALKCFEVLIIMDKLDRNRIFFFILVVCSASLIVLLQTT